MRNPQRIDRLLNVVKRLWQQQPDLRLCQLISNAVGMATQKAMPDYFYIEDEVLLKGLELYIEDILKTAIQKKRSANGQSSEPGDSLPSLQQGPDSTGEARGHGAVST